MMTIMQLHACHLLPVAALLFFSLPWHIQAACQSCYLPAIFPSTATTTRPLQGTKSPPPPTIRHFLAPWGLHMTANLLITRGQMMHRRRRRGIHSLKSNNPQNEKEPENENENDDENDENTATTPGAKDDEKPLSGAMIGTIGFYKNFISPILPPACRFLPTCSQYGVQAIKEFGPTKGCILIAWRLLRCTPLGGKGYDPPKWPPVPYTYGSY